MRAGRGQFVLLATVVLVVALVPIVVAYLQLGYHADVATSPIDSDPLADTERVLSRAVHDAGDDLPGSYAWKRRSAAERHVRGALEPGLRAVNRSRLRSGTVIRVTYNDSRARGWSETECPGGPNRQFGACVVADGLVFQNRAGRTHLLAAAFDVAVVGDRARQRYTTVREVWPTTGNIRYQAIPERRRVDRNFTRPGRR